MSRRHGLLRVKQEGDMVRQYVTVTKLSQCVIMVTVLSISIASNRLVCVKQAKHGTIPTWQKYRETLANRR